MGTGVFRVIGDGQELLKSERLSADVTQTIEVDVTGVQRLELVVESGRRSNARCWTVWGRAQLTR